VPVRCWACFEDGPVLLIYLHPIGRAYSAEVCVFCHSLRVAFCDDDLNEFDWDTLLAYPPLCYHIECRGDAWAATNPAVAALRRAVEQAERSEAADWSAQPLLRVVTGD